MALSNQNRRQHHRVQFKDTFVMNPEGTCEVVEMSSGGFSFKCLFEHSLSGEWRVDIINNSGDYIEKLPVEKVWESVKVTQHSTPIHELEVGVRFRDLSRQQKLTLAKLIHSNGTIKS